MRKQLIPSDITPQERYDLAAQALYDAKVSRDKDAIRAARAEYFAADNALNACLDYLERL